MFHISVLGRFSVVGPNKQEARIHTARGAELFAFLVLEADRMFHRARMAEQFWGHLPEARARRALNTELWRLSNALKSVGADPKVAFRRTQHEIGYCSHADQSVDVDLLHQASLVVQQSDPKAPTPTDLGIVEAGVAAYKGDLMESVYSDWCLIWRENLRNQHMACLTYLMNAEMARKAWTSALGKAQQLLQIDPLLENVHRCIMRCHFHTGNRSLALRQYALCEQLLDEELGVAPADETRRIQETILDVPPAKAALKQAQEAHPKQPPPRRDRSPAQKLDLALSNINNARNWIEDASRDLRTDRSIS